VNWATARTRFASASHPFRRPRPEIAGATPGPASAGPGGEGIFINGSAAVTRGVASAAADVCNLNLVRVPARRVGRAPRRA